jgi:predicted enzyme related to lactoylglutathione lyase
MGDIRYVHTNIVADDWQSLAHFYEVVLECRVVPPERDLSGEWLTDLTGIPGVHIRGAHLALPGYTDEGPTLEIFSYEPSEPADRLRPLNTPGIGHLAFLVDDVGEMVDRVIEGGGEIVGSIVQKKYRGLGSLTVAYCRDPEGNTIELQNWS